MPEGLNYRVLLFTLKPHANTLNHSLISNDAVLNI